MSKGFTNNKSFHINPLLFNEINEQVSEKWYRIQKAFYLFNTYLLSRHCALEVGTMVVGTIPAVMQPTNAVLHVAPNGEMKAEWHYTDLNL